MVASLNPPSVGRPSVAVTTLSQPALILHQDGQPLAIVHAATQVVTEATAWRDDADALPCCPPAAGFH